MNVENEVDRSERDRRKERIYAVAYALLLIVSSLACVVWFLVSEADLRMLTGNVVPFMLVSLICIVGTCIFAVGPDEGVFNLSVALKGFSRTLWVTIFLIVCLAFLLRDNPPALTSSLYGVEISKPFTDTHAKALRRKGLVVSKADEGNVYIIKDAAQPESIIDVNLNERGEVFRINVTTITQSSKNEPDVSARDLYYTLESKFNAWDGERSFFDYITLIDYNRDPLWYEAHVDHDLVVEKGRGSRYWSNMDYSLSLIYKECDEGDCTILTLYDIAETKRAIAKIKAHKEGTALSKKSKKDRMLSKKVSQLTAPSING